MTRSTIEHGQHRVAMERSLERPLVVFASLLAAVITAMVAGQVALSNPLVWLGLPMIWLAAWFLWVANRGTGIGDAEVGLFALASVSLYFAHISQSEARLPPGARDALLAAVVVLAMAFASRWTRMAVVVASIGAILPVEIAQHGVLSAAEFISPVIAAGFATVGAVQHLRLTADRADTAAALLREESTRAAVSAERRRSQRDINGIIHDDVVSALRAIRLGTQDWSGVRQSAASALAALERESAETLEDREERVLLTPLLKEVAARHRAHFTGDGSHVSATGPAAAAVVAATSELARNAWRHAQPSRVEIELIEGPAGWEVRVSDDGVGFNYADSSQRGHGLRHSVQGRMEAVGGESSIDSTVGVGTVATLTWTSPCPVPSGAHDATQRQTAFVANIGNLGYTLYVTVVPYLACNTLFAIHHQVAGQPAWLLGWWVLGVVMTLLAISRVNRGIPAWLSFACVVTTLAGPLAFGALVPTASINNFAAWPLGGLSGMAVALYFGRPRSWESVVTLLGLQMFVWVPAYLGYWDGVDGLRGALSATPAALSTIGPFVIGVAFAREISRLRKVASNAAEEAEVVAQFTARSIARESAFAERLGHVRNEVVPLLTMVASAKRSEPRWQEASARFEQLARDELHVPGVLNGKAREALYLARTHGCAVSFHVPDADIQNPDVVRKLILAALESSANPREFTLAVFADVDDGSERISAVTVPGDAARASRFAALFADDIVNFDDSPEATWVEVAPRTTVPARPAA